MTTTGEAAAPREYTSVSSACIQANTGCDQPIVIGGRESLADEERSDQLCGSDDQLVPWRIPVRRLNQEARGRCRSPRFQSSRIEAFGSAMSPLLTGPRAGRGVKSPACGKRAPGNLLKSTGAPQLQHQVRWPVGDTCAANLHATSQTFPSGSRKLKPRKPCSDVNGSSSSCTSAMRCRES